MVEAFERGEYEELTKLGMHTFKSLTEQELTQVREGVTAIAEGMKAYSQYKAPLRPQPAPWPVGDLEVCSIDGSLTRTPDTAANREAFGSAGTADDSSPYPQLRDLRLTSASTRALLAITAGPSGAAAGGSRDKGEAEQALLDRALAGYPSVFTPRRLWIMDRTSRESGG
jgi:hypothetical protein